MLPQNLAWLTQVEFASWPTQTATNTAMSYRLSISASWNPNPAVNHTPLEQSHTFRGLCSSDWLMVSLIEQAEPTADIRNWVEAMLHLVGFPIVPQSDPPPTLLEWQYQGACPPLADRLQVEEAHLYQGAAWLPTSPPELSRIYLLLARRGTHAWKIALSLLSACPPGTPEDQIMINDHVRAGATFGTLELL